ncbi:MAG: hypothetical protein GX879_01305, partial [Bacteroidales bacterium]|nr:hypothetical protein [Bacteroidales bacterium]
MKNNKINFVVFVGIIFALLYLSSCGGGGSNQQYKPVMNCMINSSTWRTSDPHARVSDNSIVIYGTSANGQTIQLRLYAGEQGEYSLNPQTRHEGKFIP